MINLERPLTLLDEHDAIDSYFECITACSLEGEDIECVTRCVELHLKEGSLECG